MQKVERVDLNAVQKLNRENSWQVFFEISAVLGFRTSEFRTN